MLLSYDPFKSPTISQFVQASFALQLKHQKAITSIKHARTRYHHEPMVVPRQLRYTPSTNYSHDYPRKPHRRTCCYKTGVHLSNTLNTAGLFLQKILLPTISISQPLIMSVKESSLQGPSGSLYLFYFSHTFA